MKFLFSSLVILIASACFFAEAENNKEENFQGRFLFQTVTFTLTTSTITTTSTSVTTCTTSTAGLSICTASGRRRRGLHLSENKEGRGLFYNEKEELSENGSIFLPQPEVELEPVQPVEEIESIREIRASPQPIPYVVQHGFNAPDGQGRLFFAWDTTTTVTSTSIVTSTASLTAVCRSTTGYQVCNVAGK